MLPSTIEDRTSLTHSGHSESVRRGQPRGGLVRRFCSGAGAQLGLGFKFDRHSAKRMHKGQSVFANKLAATSMWPNALSNKDTIEAEHTRDFAVRDVD